jgi:transcriptional regulator with XRE-family HTH domain
MGTTKNSKLYEQHNCVVSLLKDIRTNAGLTQIDVSNKLNKPQSYVSKYESGARQFNILEIRQICKVVGIPFITFIQMLEESLQKVGENES